MEEISLIIGLIIGLVSGFIIGWLVCKIRTYQSSDVSAQSALLSGLNTQIAEMKGKFTEIEKSRVHLERQRGKYEEEREKRLTEWMANTHRLFEEQTEKGREVDKEKDKRIQEWMEQTKQFFEEQKGAYTRFLEQQGESREEIEKKRDDQIDGMSRMISTFTRAVTGTKTRGMVGEEQLREVLLHCIKSGIVVCNLKTDSGEVEFAWNLEDGKYIPIDCKLPDVFELIDKYIKSDEFEEQKEIKRNIIDKIKKQIGNIQKHQNQSNTIDSCILVVPEGILEIAPEIVSLGQEKHVFICSYRDVFPVAYVLSEKYNHFKEEGDIGIYRQIITSLFQIIDNINAKTDSIQRGITIITNANNEIKTEIVKAKLQTAIRPDEEVGSTE